uniref:Uncharacterized protein n=1 Tax=viral metagenome TaxID=1070528 RepID=A0A6C0D5R2_9ZZZZ
MANMNADERLNLKKLINEMDCENNTENIRKLKHSVLIRDDIRKLDTLKNKIDSLKDSDFPAFLEMCQQECSFLYNNYTDIFNKMIKNELDLTIMTKLLTVLKLIEDGKTDQHEGSYMIGKVLKELYLDSAVKRADNIDREMESQKEKEKPSDGKAISWSEYKKMNL